MSAEIVAAIISGAVATVVAIGSAISSYYLGKRNLESRLAEVREGGVQDRATAEREYQLAAMRTFRESVGGPKSQIIEAAHDLSDRLRGLLSGEQPREWTEGHEYYRRSFTWLIIRPFVWIEILRGGMVYLDQTLGDLVEEELRFLRYCRLWEHSLSGAALFRGTEYDPNESSAHVFSGRLRATAEQLIKREDTRPVCMGYVEFERDSGGRGFSCAQDVELIVSNLNTDPARDFRLARLVALYCATNSLLANFHLPFREFDSVVDSLRYLESVSPDIRQTVDRNLREMLS